MSADCPLPASERVSLSRTRTPRSKHLRSPAAVLDRVGQLGDIGLDPCGVGRSPVHAGVEWRGPEQDCEDGLRRSWAGRGLVYCFPPSREVGRWARKIATEVRRHGDDVEVVALLPCRAAASWMHDYIFPAADAICYWRGTLRAIGEPHSSVTPRIVAYWGPRAHAFRNAFESAGSVVLGQHVHRHESWLIVVPRSSPTGTWINQQGKHSRAVQAFVDRFAADLRLANIKTRCPPATGRRLVTITRYSGRETSRASLRQGGALVESILRDQGLISAEFGYKLQWKQAIDRRRPRTEISIQTAARNRSR